MYIHIYVYIEPNIYVYEGLLQGQGVLCGGDCGSAINMLTQQLLDPKMIENP